jgi:hypothetical protein
VKRLRHAWIKRPAIICHYLLYGRRRMWNDAAGFFTTAAAGRRSLKPGPEFGPEDRDIVVPVIAVQPGRPS